MATLPAPTLEHVADLTVFVATPVEAGRVTGLGLQGLRRIIPITGGTLRGPRLTGRVLPGGADFQLVVSDTAADLDARYLVALDGPEFGGEHLYVQNRALRRASPEDMARLCAASRSIPRRSISAARRASKSRHRSSPGSPQACSSAPARASPTGSR